MAKKNKKITEDRSKLLDSEKYCIVLDGDWKADFIFNKYILDWKDKNNQGKLAVFKKRLTGYSWTRTYDSDWNDRTDKFYESGDPETKDFPALEEYLNGKKIDFNFLKKSQKTELLSMVKTGSHMDDPYYGSAEEEITYILIEDIDKWLEQVNSEDYMKKTFEEWLEKNFSELPSLREYGLSSDRYSHYSSEGRYEYCSKFKDIKNVENIYIHHDWSMGGTYGNCWDDSKSTSEGEIKPEFMSLDTVVELINAEVSYIKYRTKVIPLIESYTTSHGDYYGGSTTTGHERVNLYKLWVSLNAL